MEARSEKISEALRLLEEAAREKKDDLRGLIADKYEHLKSALVGAEHSVADSLSAAQKRAVEAIVQAKDASTKKVKEVAGVVDEKVHENPWPYIAGAGVVAFLFGYILGKKR
ncbi:MAG: hypothetical protein C0404_00605 [Verrucomicrobia bacterium]|nr:hypothetical protein [Verrucomicrobiota bacterium]